MCPSNQSSFYKDPCLTADGNLVTQINEAWKTKAGLLDISDDTTKVFSGKHILPFLFHFTDGPVIYYLFCWLSRRLLIHNYSSVYVAVWENLPDVTVVKFCKKNNRKVFSQ